MTNRLLLVVVGLMVAVAGVFAEDRIFKGSSLSQLINPGPQGPYPPVAPAPPEPQYGVPLEHQMYGLPQPQPAPENQGFTVQSGYEGFIFPTGPAEGLKETSALGTLGGVALGAKLLTHLLPFPLNKIALFFATKLGLWLLGLLLLLLIGGATTTAVCAFTPICTISFLGLGLVNRESTRAMLTQDRLNQATQFVHNALDKYQELEARISKSWDREREKDKKKAKKEEEEAREAKAIKSSGGVKNDLALKDTINVESPKKNIIE